MKLVDLDQRIYVPVVDETRGGMTYEMEMSVGEFFDKCCPGFRPEVVEAIPVEWIKQQFYDNPAEAWANKCRDVYTGWQRWQRLQEGQEGERA